MAVSNLWYLFKIMLTVGLGVFHHCWNPAVDIHNPIHLMISLVKEEGVSQFVFDWKGRVALIKE